MTRTPILGLLALMAVGCGSSSTDEAAAEAPAPKTNSTAPSTTGSATPPATTPSTQTGTPAPSDVHKDASGDHPPPGVD